MARNYPKEPSGTQITSEASDPMDLSHIDRRIEQLQRVQTEATTEYNIRGQALLALTGYPTYHESKRQIDKVLKAQKALVGGHPLCDAERDALVMFLKSPFCLKEGQEAAEAFYMADTRLDAANSRLLKEMEICKHLETNYGRRNVQSHHQGSC